MKEFHLYLLNQSKPFWEKTVNHSFLETTANGSISHKTFKIWIQQDYLFVEAAIPFMAVLLAKSSLDLRTNFIQIISGLDKELELFRRNADAAGISLNNIESFPICHAYIQFLMNTGYNKSFEEGFTVLYAAEKAYLDSWMYVKKNLKGKSPWQSFIDNWSSEGFQQYVDWLAKTLDNLVAEKHDRELAKLIDIFNITVRYEYLFWEMAANKLSWPI